MAYQEWRKWYDARQVVNADESVRKALQDGTYAGSQPIADESEWDSMIEQANNTLEEFSEVPDMVDAAGDGDQPRGLFARLFGR